MRVAVDFSWVDLGAVALDAGKLRFPQAPELPGIYRFNLGDRWYIGETDRLRRRFQVAQLEVEAGDVKGKGAGHLLIAGGGRALASFEEVAQSLAVLEHGKPAPAEVVQKARRREMVLARASLAGGGFVDCRGIQIAPGLMKGGAAPAQS